MLQLIGLLAVSWLLLRFLEKKDLAVLGLTPTVQRSKYFLWLLITSVVVSVSAYLLRMYFVKEVYALAPSLTLKSVLQESWYQVRTVLTEELLCRGALLYILIRRIGRRNAVVVSSVLFALLHWMNAGVFGNLVQMIVVFSFTFTMGLLLAYAYARTFSILLPFAIHFGWNYVQNFVFPDSASGQHLFMLAAPPPEVTISYLAFYTMLMVPKLLVLVLNYLIVRQHPEMKMP